MIEVAIGLGIGIGLAIGGYVLYKQYLAAHIDIH